MPRNKLTENQAKILNMMLAENCELSLGKIADITRLKYSLVGANLANRLVPFGYVRRVERGIYQATGKQP